MQGRIDNIDVAVLRGWGWNPATPKSRLVGRIFADGSMIGEVVLNQYRRDLEAAKVGDGAHGFRFLLPTALRDGQSHLFRLEVDGEAGPVTLHTRTLDVARSGITGRFERIAGGICQGWALDNRDMDRRVTVEVLADGVVLAEATAQYFRKDLQRAGFGDGRYGFHLQLPESILRKASPNQTLIARVQGADGEPPEEIGSLTLPSKELIKGLVMRGRVAQQQGQRAEAARIFENVLEIDPRNVDSLWRLARLLISESGDRVRARDLADQAERLKPGIAEVNLILARLDHDEKQHEAALARWKRITPAENAYRESLLKAGRCLHALGRPVEAIVPARKAIALNADDLDATRLLAESYMLAGVPQLALPHLTRLAALQPNDRQAQNRLAKAQAVVGATMEQEVPEPLMVLRNPALRNWTAAAVGEVRDRTVLAEGVVLRPLSGGEAVGYRIAKPQEFKPNGMPFFGLQLSSARSGFELEQELDPQKAAVLRRGLRVSFEVEVPHGAAEARLELYLRDAAAPESASTLLWSGQAGAMPRLDWCDLKLGPAEESLLLAGRLVLVLRSPDPATVLWNPPRPVRLLATQDAWGSSDHAPPLPEALRQPPPPSEHGVPRFRFVPTPEAEDAWSMAHPYTTVVIWEKAGGWSQEALDRSLDALCGGENLPAVFRIAIPTRMAARAMAWLAARPADPRLSLRPDWRLGDEATTWIAFLRAGTVPPAQWLRGLHDEARQKGLAICGGRDAFLAHRAVLEAREGARGLIAQLAGGQLLVGTQPMAKAPVRQAPLQLVTGK